LAVSKNFTEQINSTVLLLDVFSYKGSKAEVPFNFDWKALSMISPNVMVLKLNFSDPLMVSKEVRLFFHSDILGNAYAECDLL